MVVFVVCVGDLHDATDGKEVFVKREQAVEYLKEHENIEIKEDECDGTNKETGRWGSIERRYLWGLNPTHDAIRAYTKRVFINPLPVAPNGYVGDIESEPDGYLQLHSETSLFVVRVAVWGTEEDIAKKQEDNREFSLSWDTKIINWPSKSTLSVL